jgi:hypothetical protein
LFLGNPSSSLPKAFRYRYPSEDVVLPVQSLTPISWAFWIPRELALPTKSLIPILRIKKYRWQELFPATYTSILHGLMDLVMGSL